MVLPSLPLLLTLALLAGPAPATASFGPGEQIDFAIEFRGLPSGEARMVVGRPQGAVWPVICQARSGGVAAMVDVREHFVSYWDADRGSSRGSDLNAVELTDKRTERSRFDRENGTVTTQVVRKGRANEVTREVPRDVHDVASALLELRLRPPPTGGAVEFPVYTGNYTFVLKAQTEGQEQVTTPAGRFDTLRVKVKLGFKARLQTDRDAYVWISNDDRRIPVQMAADFAIGRLTLILTAYQPGRTPTANR